MPETTLCLMVVSPMVSHRSAIPGRKAWAVAWPLAAQLDPQRTEEALAQMDSALQQLQGYGRRGVEGCKEGDGNGMGPCFYVLFICFRFLFGVAKGVETTHQSFCCKMLFFGG